MRASRKLKEKPNTAKSCLKKQSSCLDLDIESLKSSDYIQNIDLKKKKRKKEEEYNV